MTNWRVFSRLQILPDFVDRVTFHTVAGAFATRIKNTPIPTVWVAKVVLGDPVLPLPGDDSRSPEPRWRRPSPDPTGEPARQPHQMRVVEGVVAVVVPAPPPHPKSARVVTDTSRRSARSGPHSRSCRSTARHSER